jgi:hypothetical protein
MRCSLGGRAMYRENDAGDEQRTSVGLPMTVIGEAHALDQGRCNEPSVKAPAGCSKAPNDQHRKEQHHRQVQDDIERQLWMLTRRAAPGDRFQAMRPHAAATSATSRPRLIAAAAV